MNCLQPNMKLRAVTGRCLESGALFALIMFVSCVTVVGPLIIFGPMFLGFHRAILELVRTRKVKVSTLFSGFKDFGVAFRAGWLWGIRIFLWSLLLFVPGIIAAIRYSMTFFILADNPNITAREAINKSKDMIEGRKYEFFQKIGIYIIIMKTKEILCLFLVCLSIFRILFREFWTSFFRRVILISI